MSFLTDLVTGFAALLDGASIGLTWNADGSAYAVDETGIYVGNAPLDVDRAVVLMPYPLTDDPSLSDSEVGMQVRSRSAAQDPRDVFDLDDAVADVLLGNYPLDLATGIRVVTLIRSSSVSLGQDDRRRWQWASSYPLSLHRPSLHRV
jgi:hypothetical protein